MAVILEHIQEGTVAAIQEVTEDIQAVMAEDMVATEMVDMEQISLEAADMEVNN